MVYRLDKLQWVFGYEAPGPVFPQYTVLKLRTRRLSGHCIPGTSVLCIASMPLTFVFVLVDRLLRVFEDLIFWLLSLEVVCQFGHAGISFKCMA